MNWLVDGHNLIGQIPHISLADPDDEARLVMLLRSYATRRRGRQMIIVFDHGVYGHPQSLDGYGITCYFAKSPQDADSHLIKRIRALRNPREWTLISSDRRVAGVAHEHGVRVISSHDFAAQLLAPPSARTPAPDEKPDIRLSEADIAEWLRIFGQPPDEEAPEPPAPKPAPKPTPKPPARSRKRRR